MKENTKIDLKEIIDEPEYFVDPGFKKAIKDYFYILNNPKIFGANEYSIIVELENAFEGIVATLEDCGARGVKKMNTFEFYKRIEYYDKKFSTNKTPDEKDYQ